MRGIFQQKMFFMVIYKDKVEPKSLDTRFRGHAFVFKSCDVVYGAPESQTKPILNLFT